MASESLTQSGNVLWFILLGVALLGFLTIIISRSGSSVEQSGNSELARVKAAALIRYTKSVENSVARLLSQGLSENDLDFKALGASFDNPSCTNDDCDLFKIDGGGIDYKTPAELLGDQNFTGTWIVTDGNRIGGTGCDTATNECKELILSVKGLSDDLCKQINIISGIQNPGGAPPQQQYFDETAYTGSFTTNANNYIAGGTSAANESPQVKGKTAGCFTKFNGTAENYFFQILIAR